MLGIRKSVRNSRQLEGFDLKAEDFSAKYQYELVSKQFVSTKVKNKKTYEFVDFAPKVFSQI